MIFDYWARKCSICKRKMKSLNVYVNDAGERIKVCVPCSEYAERRAFRKLK